MGLSSQIDTITSICSVQRTLKENPGTGFWGLMTPTIFSQPDTFADEGRKYYMGPSEEVFFVTASPGRSWGELENMSALISAADLSRGPGASLEQL